MNRILASLSAIGLLAAATTAQCLNLASPGTLIGVGDDTTFTPHFALGFSFPIAGSALGTYTHFRTTPNGWLILTDGTTTPTGIPTGYGADATLAGTVAGYSPRIAPFWRDMTVIAPGGVYYDNTSNPGVSCKISWKDTRDYNVLPLKSYQAELFATGEVRFSYSAGMNVVQASPAWVGLSRGNGQTVPAQTDLSAGGASAGVGMVFQTFATGAFDLGGRTIAFTPDGSGGFNTTTTCTGAYNEKYGVGCYAYTQANESFYQLFASSAAASASLQGNAMVLAPTANGYSVAWVPGGSALYVAPTGGATVLPLGDDTSDTITPSIPMPSPFGSSAQIAIAHNGIITLAATSNTTGFAPTGALMAAHTNTAFYNWFDLNNNEVGSGGIKWEEVGGILYVTWDGVEGYDSPAVVNPHTFQFQLDLNTGVVTMVWVSVNLNSFAGRQWLVGYTDQGVSLDPGSINLATALPITTSPDVQLLPLALSASPAPTFSIGNPSVPITYTINNVIDAAPPFGIGLPFLIFSLGSLPGIDLGPLGIDIGAGGCNLYIASLDVTLSPSGTAPTSTITLSIPQPLSSGTTFYAQAVSFFAPNSLPNGQNNLGAVFSNGLKQYFETF